jgi:hypothetical protein
MASLDPFPAGGPAAKLRAIRDKAALDVTALTADIQALREKTANVYTENVIALRGLLLLG